MKNIFYIYNPFSGGRINVSELDKVIEAFLKKDFYVHPHRLYTIENDNMLCDRIKTAHTNFDAIVISGGDGTVSTIVNLLIENNIELPIGIIPTGTCNDFTHSIGLPNDIYECIDIICNFKYVNIDVGKITTENKNCYFINSIGAGVFVNVSYKTNPDLKKRYGALAYYFAAIGELGAMKPFKLEIKTEDEIIKENVLLFIILNGRDVGGINNMIKNADMQDGKMNIMIVRDCSNIEKASILINLIAGKVNEDKNLIFLNCKSCMVTADKSLDVSIDGEKGFELPYKIEMVERCLNILAP